MKRGKSVNKFVLIFGAIALIVLTSFITYYYSGKSTTESLDFFKEYSIALNNIYVGLSYSDFANLNLQKLEDYTKPNGTGYLYKSAEPIADAGMAQAVKSKDYLIRAKTKLEGIKDSAKNNFFNEDISNRIEETGLLMNYAAQIYNLLNYTKQELYEINYGSKAKADEYLKKTNNLIPEFNSNLDKLSGILHKIDLAWDQDWYPNF